MSPPSFVVALSASQYPKRDYQLVDFFLRSYENGRFAHGEIPWLDQSESNVEVIAKDLIGTTLAIEHTLVVGFQDFYEFEDWISQATKEFASDRSLVIRRRVIHVSLPVDAFSHGQPWGEIDSGLQAWARELFPSLPVGMSEIQVSISLNKGKSQDFRAFLHVSECQIGSEAILVHGLPPGEAEEHIVKGLQKALERKVPKLVAANSDLRILILELHGMLIDQTFIVDELRTHQNLSGVDAVVLAYTSGLKLVDEIHFRNWQPGANCWQMPWVVKIKAQAVDSV